MTDEKKDDMDAVLAAMSNKLEVTENNTYEDHPRFYTNYKNYGLDVQKQKERREEWLENLRKRRSNIHDERRRKISGNTEELAAVEPSSSSLDAPAEDMDTSSTAAAGTTKPRRPRKNSQGANNNKPGSWRNAMEREKKFTVRSDVKGRLMYSEWLMHIPDDFHENWVMVPAPVAKRVIIVFEDRDCRLYNKSGRQLSRFPIPYYVNSTVILDGFFNGQNVYILDFIQCGPFELEGCDFGCRRLMGKNFLDEKEILAESNQPAKWRFQLIEPVVDCTKEAMEKFLSEPTPYELDGLMFYYKEGFYTPGVTPLVAWLKPWMMPEILGVAVHPVFMKDAKESQQEFIEEFSKDHPTYGKVLSTRKMKEVIEKKEQGMEVSIA